MSSLLQGLQRLGRALMLPIAVLPIAGLLLRCGAGDVFDIKLMFSAGEIIFKNLPLIFAIGVAVGLSKDDAGAAGLAGAIGHLVFTTAIATIDSEINMGVLSGILMGICAGYLYNRYHAIKLPEWLGFFGGKRFVPIATALSACILAFAFGLIWPPIQAGIDMAGNWMIDSGSFGAFGFGTLNRLLIPTGLHHILNNIVWFVFGEFGEATGDLHRFFAKDPTAGTFMVGFYPVMMFGLPAACLAMYKTAKPENRKRTAGVLISVAFTSFLTGITEPVEFIFMFLAPVLYLFHALATGLSLALCEIIGIKHGFSFSAGAIDFALNYGLSTKAWMLIPMGLFWGVAYYTVFVYSIKKFDLKTPGREDEDEIIKGFSAAETKTSKLAENFLYVLGGFNNISKIDACITRLRLEVKNKSIIDHKILKALGAKGVIDVGKNGLQVVLGPLAEIIATEMKNIPKDKQLAPVNVTNSKESYSVQKNMKKTGLNNKIDIIAPVSGKIVSIEDVPDSVFSDKVVGDGIAIIPSGNVMVAPCDGKIGTIFETNHAFSMETKSGVELFVHFGIDTVNLRGKGFKRIAKEGDAVKAGDVVINYDLDLLKKNAKSIITPIVISNVEEMESLIKYDGNVTAGKDTVLTVKM